MQQLQGKTALVAGGGRNNGKAIALAFAREGADLILVAREKRAELDQVAHDCEKLTSQPQRAHVVASKTGLYGLIKALALELGPYNIRANLIALSLIYNVRANPEWYPDRGAGGHTDEELAGVALRRTGKPEEVANVAVFLASDQSSFVTGDRILCNGGKYM